MVLSESEKLTMLITSAWVIRRTKSTMVRSVVALSVCEAWVSFTSIDAAISSDSPGAVQIRKVVGRSEIFYAEIIAWSSAETA